MPHSSRAKARTRIPPNRPACRRKGCRRQHSHRYPKIPSREKIHRSTRASRARPHGNSGALRARVHASTQRSTDHAGYRHDGASGVARRPTAEDGHVAMAARRPCLAQQRRTGLAKPSCSHLPLSRSTTAAAGSECHFIRDEPPFRDPSGRSAQPSQKLRWFWRAAPPGGIARLFWRRRKAAGYPSTRSVRPLVSAAIPQGSSQHPFRRS